jgi:hypothetical protein
MRLCGGAALLWISAQHTCVSEFAKFCVASTPRISRVLGGWLRSLHYVELKCSLFLTLRSSFNRTLALYIVDVQQLVLCKSVHWKQIGCLASVGLISCALSLSSMYVLSLSLSLSLSLIATNCKSWMGESINARFLMRTGSNLAKFYSMRSCYQSHFPCHLNHNLFPKSAFCYTLF